MRYMAIRTIIFAFRRALVGREVRRMLLSGLLSKKVEATRVTTHTTPTR